MQMRLSHKCKTFSQLFVPFQESTSHLKHSEKNMMVIANAFAKLQTVKNFLRPFCKKCRLGTRFHSQHVKVLQNLAKSP